MLSKNEKNINLFSSKYTKNVDIEKPLNEYPRPIMERDNWINLNGRYQYAILPIDAGLPLKFDGEIIVPFCVESYLSGVQKNLSPDEKLWYQKTFDWITRDVQTVTILHFEAIDYESEIYINGIFVGRNRGGYLPFSFDISSYLTIGKNKLLIGVTDPTDTGFQERGKQVLNPKGIWYTATSGIWQTVWMENLNPIHFDTIKIITDIDKGVVRINPIVRTTENITCKISIQDQKKLVADLSVKPNHFTEITLKNCKLWSPESPFLYLMTLKLYVGENNVDNVKSYFGMRKIAIEKDNYGYPRIFLNNKPYFQVGILDQGYFPDGLLTPPTDQAMIDDILIMKDLGFNMLRKHIKIESQRYYYHCDRLGMLVWQDMPSGGEGYIGNIMAFVLPNIGIHINDKKYRLFHRQNLKGRQEFESNLNSMISHLFNHPSICCWVPFNEGWGQFDAKRIAENIKKYDPSRLVDHASGWHDQKGIDFNSVHRYILDIKLPKKNMNRPFVLSEFGGYSQVISSHVWDEKNSFGYKMFETKNSLSDAYEMLIREQVIPLIQRGLSATVYTQLSDVELEVNGVLTYDREIVKFEKFMMRSLNEQIKKSL